MAPGGASVCKFPADLLILVYSYQSWLFMNTNASQGVEQMMLLCNQ